MRPRTYTVKFEIGCIVARKRGIGFLPADEHHLTLGGRHGAPRLGHDQTVGLNRWSHQGRPLPEYGWDAAECRRRLGPSYAIEPDAFRALWTDTGNAEAAQDAMLAYQNQLIADHERRTSIYPPGFSEAGHQLGDEP